MNGRRPLNEKKTVCIELGLLLLNTNCKTIYTKRACHNGDFKCRLQPTFIHTCNIETCITLATCTHDWKPLLWQHTPIGIQDLCSLPRYIVPLRLYRTYSSQFFTQIQYEYYGGNIYVSIGGI